VRLENPMATQLTPVAWRFSRRMASCTYGGEESVLPFQAGLPASLTETRMALICLVDVAAFT